MKKLLITCLAAMFAATSASAQTASPSAEKESVIIDFFARSRAVPVQYVEVFRSAVMAGFADRGRHNIIDAEASRALTANVPGSGLTTPEGALADQAAYLAERAPQVAETGARYLITGAVADYAFAHVDIPSRDSKKPPIPGFSSTFRVVISAYDLVTGQQLPDELYTLTASAPLAADADLAALTKVRSSMEYYINKNFKFETIILQLGPTDKKGRVGELYINCGTDMGVKNGDLFIVWEEVPIGGVMTRQKVGKLRVNSVQNPTVSKCKMNKGDEEIISAFQAGRTLICVSDSEALF